MVIGIRVAADNLIVRIALILVLGELFRRFRASHRVNDDLFQRLQPFHRVADGIGAFDRGPHTRAVALKIADALRLCTIRRDKIGIGHALFGLQPFPQFPVRGFADTQLIENVQGQLGRVVADLTPVRRIGKPAKVQPLIGVAEILDFLIRDLPQFDVGEHLAACACCLTQILIGVCCRIAFFQGLGLRNEKIAQPVRVIRHHFQIGRRMNKGIRAGVKHSLIHKVGSRFRGVKG